MRCQAGSGAETEEEKVLLPEVPDGMMELTHGPGQPAGVLPVQMQILRKGVLALWEERK